MMLSDIPVSHLSANPSSRQPGYTSIANFLHLSRRMFMSHHCLSLSRSPQPPKPRPQKRKLITQDGSWCLVLEMILNNVALYCQYWSFRLAYALEHKALSQSLVISTLSVAVRVSFLNRNVIHLLRRRHTIVARSCSTDRIGSGFLEVHVQTPCPARQMWLWYNEATKDKFIHARVGPKQSSSDQYRMRPSDRMVKILWQESSQRQHRPQHIILDFSDTYRQHRAKQDRIVLADARKHDQYIYVKYIRSCTLWMLSHVFVRYPPHTHTHRHLLCFP